MWGTQLCFDLHLDVRRFIPTHVGNALIPELLSGKRPVHPHACGERGVLARGGQGHHGSSPRMWGTLHVHDAVVRVHRFIPTHVGNAPDRRHRAERSPVHPHACGERVLMMRRFSRIFGSSPRMWGTLTEGRHVHQKERFIPTHVGNAISLSPGLA